MLKRKNMILRSLIQALVVLLAIPAVFAGLAPENTLAAFKTACEIDVNAVNSMFCCPGTATSWCITITR